MAAVPHVSEAAPTVAVERLVTAADVGLVTTVPEGRAQARASGKHPHHVSLARWVLGGGTSIVEKERAVMVRVIEFMQCADSHCLPLAVLESISGVCPDELRASGGLRPILSASSIFHVSEEFADGIDISVVVLGSDHMQLITEMIHPGRAG